MLFYCFEICIKTQADNFPMSKCTAVVKEIIITDCSINAHFETKVLLPCVTCDTPTLVLFYAYDIYLFIFNLRKL